MLFQPAGAVIVALLKLNPITAIRTSPLAVPVGLFICRELTLAVDPAVAEATVTMLPA